MIVILDAAQAPAEREAALARLRAAVQEHDLEVREFGPNQPEAVEVLGLPTAREEAIASALRTMDGVAAVLTTERPAFRVSGADREPSQIAVEEARFGAGAVSVIAGPCAVEDEGSLLSLAHELRAAGATALRGGAFKPRTSPYAFQGLGAVGLEILSNVSRATGLAIVTEVLDPRDVDLVARHAAVLQIGSRNMMNYALLREAGMAGKPVLLKRGMSATLHEFLLSAEYLAHAGCTDILLCERGLRHFDPAVRNLLDLAAVPALRAETHLPVIVDPSHGTGRADLVAPMLVAAAAAGADGLLVEVHGQPERSYSDAGQAIGLTTFARAMQTVEAVLAATSRRLVKPAVPVVTP